MACLAYMLGIGALASCLIEMSLNEARKASIVSHYVLVCTLPVTIPFWEQSSCQILLAAPSATAILLSPGSPSYIVKAL